jgi:hydroxymethylglutaryl-CoA lyase
MPTLPKHAHIVDVGPRDGLQNEKQMIPADVKVELVDRLTDAGFGNIEVTSFVSPKWVPQMSDAAEVMARIRRKPGVTYSVLVPNAKGMEGALAAKADEIVVFTAASEAFSLSPGSDRVDRRCRSQRTAKRCCHRELVLVESVLCRC